MANLKDLIVNGAARIIGKTYSSEFVGNVTGDLAGNAATATKASQDSEGNVIKDTYFKCSGGIIDGHLDIHPTNNTAGSYDEGIRIAVGKNGYSALSFGSSATSTTGTIDGQWWLGCNHESKPRKLFISHNGADSSETYFYADSSTQKTPSLNVGGKITANEFTGNLAASNITGTLGVGHGGTGIASFTAGDILYASGTSTLATLNKGTDGQVLKLSGGKPAWGTDNTPTKFAWTNGTTAGPTGSLTGNGMSAVNFAAIPSASESTSGIVTTDTQTFAGAKTFNDTITGSITGNAGTATKLKTARSLKITDDGTNTSTGVDFDGSDAVTLKLPSTIKASLAGNATTATTADKIAYGISVGDGVSSTTAISSWKGNEAKTLTIKGTSPIATTATTDTITITHNKGGADTSKGDTSNQTPGFGGTFKVTSTTVDAYGHTTTLADHTVTIPSSVATTSANGLMSSADKTTLDNVAGTYATKEEVSTELAKKANETHSHAISDITNLQTSLDAKLATSDLAGQLLSKVYPVGSIYLSVNSTSPASFLGGTWEQLKDRFLLGAGSKSAGATGGEENHTLTTAEMPSHSHTRGSMEITGSMTSVEFDPQRTIGGSGAFSVSDQKQYWTKSCNPKNKIISSRDVTYKASSAWSGNTSSVGSGTSHNNMPPYLVVYMWKRTE